jgi:hypothetical protein
MSIYDARGLEIAFQKASTQTTKSAGTPASPAFTALPMFWTASHYGQAPASAQNTLFLLACQQAAVVFEEVHRRRRSLFARGVHLWN